jgi:hypothetical protein
MAPISGQSGHDVLNGRGIRKGNNPGRAYPINHGVYTCLGFAVLRPEIVLTETNSQFFPLIQ